MENQQEMSTTLLFLLLIKHSICDPTEAKELLDWETKNDVLDYINDTYL